MLQWAFIGVCWFVGAMQWAMMMTDGHWRTRSGWPEILIVGEVVTRSFLMLAMMFGSFALSDFIPYPP